MNGERDPPRPGHFVGSFLGVNFHHKGELAVTGLSCDLPAPFSREGDATSLKSGVVVAARDVRHRRG